MTGRSHAAGHPGRPPRVAYVMSRFPKLTETFVLYEMLALEERGVAVEIFPLLRQREEVRHAEAERLVHRARFRPFLSWTSLRAMASFARRDPRRSLRAWWDTLSGTWGSANFFVGALALLPKVARMAREMEELGVQHIHAHFANHPALAAFLVHRLTGIPYSFTAHGSDLHVDRRMLPEKVREAAFVVTVSRYNRELIVEECGKDAGEKVAVVHCGVDPSAFGPSPARWEEDGPVRVVCVGSLEEVKGHRFLVEAMELLEERRVPVECHLVGDGPLRHRVAEQVEAAGLSHRVRLRGGLPRHQVARILADGHVAVQPSRPTRSGKREGIPVALMEAMAAELPVVASAVSGIPELVCNGESGILVPPGEPRPLAEGLERLARDPSLRLRMGAAGRRRIEEAFDIRRTSAGILALMERHLRRPSPDPAAGSEAGWPPV